MGIPVPLTVAHPRLAKWTQRVVKDTLLTMTDSYGVNKSTKLTRDILADVFKERLKQDKKWGEQNHESLYWLGIVTEELGESAKAVIEHKDWSIIREELIQTAACLVSWIESVERQSKVK